MDQPIRYKFLDLAEVNAPLQSELLEAVGRVALSGRYIGGEEVKRFEQTLARTTGTDYAVGVSNGLDAIRLILRAYLEEGFLKPGDEVIVPSDTYIATILAVLDCGLRPVFVEPRLDTLNIDTDRLAAAIGPRTRVILTVHLYGRVAYDAEMQRLADLHGIRIVEDNAQAIGARHSDGRLTGALGHAAAFSFYPTKNIGALGDAGAVTTSDAATAARVRAIANYGSDRTYHNIYRGLNCRLDPMQAAVLSAKLPGLDAIGASRRLAAAAYDAAITHSDVTKPPLGAEDMVWHQYVVRVPRRDEFRSFLASRGVETAIHYPTPPHRQPCMAEFASLSLPVADRIAREVVSLPIATVSAADAAEIGRIINEFPSE